MPTVLVVEDEQAIAYLISEVLREEGYRVMTEADGQAGLECVRATKPDLVLSNIMLPKLDGHQLAQAMYTDPALRAIPLVLMSAGSEPGPTGFFVGFVQKPFTLTSLLSIVTRALHPL